MAYTANLLSGELHPFERFERSNEIAAKPTTPSGRSRGIVVFNSFTRCTKGAQPGAIALGRHWTRFTGRKFEVFNCRKTASGAPSLHGEGRAVDLYAKAADPVQARQADAYVAWLIANAVEIQCQTIIWNRRIWSWHRRAQGWRAYHYNPHTDHIHVDLNWEGALQPSRLLSIPGIGSTSSTVPRQTTPSAPAAGRVGPPARPPAKTTTKRRRPSAADFCARYRAFAERNAQTTGVPALVTLGQAALESGWGVHAPGFNFFGIKARATDPPETRQLLQTREVFQSPNVTHFPEIISVERRPDGRYNYTVRAWFRRYASPEESFAAHGRLLRNNRRYAAAFAYTSDPYRFIQEVARAGYATGPTYAAEVSSVMRDIERACGVR